MSRTWKDAPGQVQAFRGDERYRKCPPNWRPIRLRWRSITDENRQAIDAHNDAIADVDWVRYDGSHYNRAGLYGWRGKTWMKKRFHHTVRTREREAIANEDWDNLVTRYNDAGWWW